jgi:hypothetical protein
VAERSAAEQVKALVEAAEREAQQSREGVERVAEHADELLRRVDELSAGVAEAAAALRREIEALREPEEAAPVAAAPPPAEDPGTRLDSDADDERIAEAEAVAGRTPDAGDETPTSEGAAEEAPAPDAPDADASAVPEGARLLALKMALDGRSREETAAYLHENFELAGIDALLDEVYARAEARK